MIPHSVHPNHHIVAVAAAADAADFAVVTDWPAKSSCSDHRMIRIMVRLPVSLMLAVVTMAAVLAVAGMVPVIDSSSSRIPSE